MPGWFANGRADRERLGGNARDKSAAPGQRTGSGFQKREGFARKIVKRVAGAIIDNTTGRITNSKAVQGIRGVPARIRKGECAFCGTKLRGNRTYGHDFGEWSEKNPEKNAIVCSKKCARKLEAQGFDTIQEHMDKLGKDQVKRGRAATQEEWEKITGGIRYDNDGKRIWD